MVLELLEAGEKVVVLDNLSTGRRWAVHPDAELVVGDFGDAALVKELLASRDVDAIIHFAAKIVVPESVSDPLGYYLNNTASARSLLACAVESGVKQFIFSSTAAVYGDPEQNPVTEDETLKPVSPYGRSKLMVEWMLADTAAGHDLNYVVLRYFNVAGADPQGRTGQSFANATHLIKVAVQTALGMRKGMEIFGTDYPTPDGTCLRDYIQVTDLARAHMDALKHLRAGGDNLTCNCGYERGYSVLGGGRHGEEGLGRRFRGENLAAAAPAIPQRSSPTTPARNPCWAGRRFMTTWRRSCARPWPGRRSCWRNRTPADPSAAFGFAPQPIQIGGIAGDNRDGDDFRQFIAVQCAYRGGQRVEIGAPGLGGQQELSFPRRRALPDVMAGHFRDLHAGGKLLAHQGGGHFVRLGFVVDGGLDEAEGQIHPPVSVRKMSSRTSIASWLSFRQGTSTKFSPPASRKA